MVVLSEQAQGIANHMKEFNLDDFELWYSKLHKVTIVGTDKVIQYIDMKSRGFWKNGEFIIPEEKNGR